MNFFQTAGTAIYNKLSGASSLTTALGGTAIYYQQAPDNKALPYVVWNFQSATDENSTPSRMWNSIINIRSFAASPSQSGTVDALIDGLLNGAALSMDGWTNFYTARELAFSDVVTEEDKSKTWVSGGFYRIRMGQ